MIAWWEIVVAWVVVSPLVCVVVGRFLGGAARLADTPGVSVRPIVPAVTTRTATSVAPVDDASQPTSEADPAARIPTVA